MVSSSFTRVVTFVAMVDAVLAITGAGGFVGSHVTRLAAAEGWQATGLIRSEAAAERVRNDGGRPQVVGDLGVERLAEGMRGARAVVHLAQVGSERDGASYEEVNVQGTRRVIEAARRAGVARAVYFSGLGVAHYGMTRPCTNRYFLSKLAAEIELFRSGLEVVVFRPSYILGPQGELIPDLLRQMKSGEVEIAGDGSYRMMPVAVRDAAAAVLAAAARTDPDPAVFDLVGPEPVSLVSLIERVAGAARRSGRSVPQFSLRSLPLAEARRQAAAGGYRGLGPDQLECLICDEVADHGPLEALLGRFLTPLDEVLATALRGAPA